MAHLVFRSGDRSGETVSLPKVVCMGRGLDMDVRLDDLTASKRHARIISNDRGEYILEDLASSNGTFLNGVQVTTKKLKNGDTIRIGNSLMEFCQEEKSEPAEATESGVLNIGQDSTSSSVISSVDVNFGAAGPTAGATTSLEEVRKLNYRLSTVLEISQALGKALDEDELLNRILDKLFDAFPETGRGFIILRDPDSGQLTPRASRMAKSGGPADEQLQISETILEYVLEQKQAVLSTEAREDERFATSQSILDFEMRAVMCAPLTYEEDVLGFIWMDTQRIASNYTEDGLSLLAGIANQAALTIANARLHTQLLKRERLEQDLRTARRLQNSFLPQRPPEIDGYEFVTWYDTALEVGGDFYDLIEIPDNKIMVVVGDVSGKGITAALMMAKMTSNVRYFAGTQTQPGDMLRKLNEVALRSETDMFVTMLIMCVDYNNHSVVMSNAGHCYPMLRKTSGEVTRVEGGNGYPVAITEEAEFPEATIELEAGDVLCLFTDGIIEAMDEESNLFGYEKLTPAMSNGGQSAGDVMMSIQQAIRDHAGGAPQSDDLTVICMGRTLEDIDESI